MFTFPFLKACFPVPAPSKPIFCKMFNKSGKRFFDAKYPYIFIANKLSWNYIQMNKTVVTLAVLVSFAASNAIAKTKEDYFLQCKSEMVAAISPPESETGESGSSNSLNTDGSSTDKNTDKAKVEVATEVVCSGDLVVNENQFYMCEGSLRDNVDRLAVELDFKKVVWSRLPNCVDWETTAAYPVPPQDKESKELLSASVFKYVFDGYPLVAEITTVDNVLIIHPTKQFKCEEAL